MLYFVLGCLFVPIIAYFCKHTFIYFVLVVAVAVLMNSSQNNVHHLKSVVGDNYEAVVLFGILWLHMGAMFASGLFVKLAQKSTNATVAKYMPKIWHAYA